MASVVIKEGDQSRKFELSVKTTIGKKSDNLLPLVEVSASRYHCVIEESNKVWSIQDLGSRNGTYLNGKKCEGKLPLNSGDLIQIGKTFLKFSDDQIATKSSNSTPQVKAVNLPVKSVTSSAGRIDKFRDIKIQIHKILIDKLDLKKMGNQVSDEDLRKRTEASLIDIIRDMPGLPADIDRRLIVKEVTDEAVGLGPLEDLLEDETITEIMVNAYNMIFVERSGKIQLSEKAFTDNAQVIQAIRRIIAPLGRRIDETSPMVDARLKDGSRVNAIISPLAISGPTLTIRKFSKKPFQIEDLVRFDSISDKAAQFLILAVQERMNVLISGGTGSGKTTLLNVISGFIPMDERIVTIEDAAELQLPQDHVVTLEAKPPNLDGAGAIPIRKLLINSLRMRPDRIVVGECRGGEALDMLQAMNTGHDGSLTTLHANTCRDALSRLETLVLMAGMDLPTTAIRGQIASAINIIVQISRMKDGTRKVISISELVGMEGDIITLQELFKFDHKGFDEDGKVKGKMIATGSVAKFIFELKERGIPIDMNMFAKEEA